MAYPKFLVLLAAQTVFGIITISCPNGYEVSGWRATNFIYMVYDQVQPDGRTTTTAHVNLDVVGGYSNLSYHCEATTPTPVNPGGIWINCTTNTTTEYTTSLQYKPDEYWSNRFTLRETTTCVNGSRQLRTSLFKGALAGREFLNNQDPPPELPPNATDLQTWTRHYYSSFTIAGRFTLLPPPLALPCPPPAATTMTWEIDNFSFNASCFHCWDPDNPGEYGLPDPTPDYPGFETAFHLVNRASGYEADCYHLQTDYLNFAHREWYTCGWDPDDAPYMPVTWFKMDRDNHTLSFNQSWTCDDDERKTAYAGQGSLYVPWDCEAGPGNYTKGGCKVQMTGVVVEGALSRRSAK